MDQLTTWWPGNDIYNEEYPREVAEIPAELLEKEAEKNKRARDRSNDFHELTPLEDVFPVTEGLGFSNLMRGRVPLLKPLYPG